MNINNFKPFATGLAADVVTQVEFEADTTLLSQGFKAGTANSLKLNKVWRQASFISAAIAQFVSNAGYDVLDDGNLNTFLSNFLSARNAFLNKNVAGNTDITLDPLLEANYPTLNLTGILTGNINIFIPASRQANYNIINATTGAFSITFKVTGSTGGVVIPQSFSTVIASDGTFVYQISTNAAQTNVQLQSVSASVAGNALTVSLNPTSLSFRNAALNSGAISTINIGATLNLTVPNGASIGTLSSTLARLLILAINNAGTIELAITNLGGGLQLDETNLISTVAIGATSNGVNVIYSATARNNVAYRVVGFIDTVQVAGGAWSSLPTVIQGIGGQALAALSSLGYGQKYNDVTGSRAVGTTYINTTGKPIFVVINTNSNTSSVYSLSFTINGIATATSYLAGGSAGYGQNFFIIIPPLGTYSVNGQITINKWLELS